LNKKEQDYNFQVGKPIFLLSFLIKKSFLLDAKEYIRHLNHQISISDISLSQTLLHQF